MSSILIKPLLVFGGGIVLWHSIGIDFTAKTYTQLVFKGSVILMVYSVIAYMFCLDEESCRRIKAKFKIINVKSQA